MSHAPPPSPASHVPWRQRLHEVIFEADTPEGKTFDVALLVAILLSILVVMLESVASIDADYHLSLRVAEWVFTVLFTIEYVLRLLCVRHPTGYIFSFYGIIDLLAVIPTYASLLIPGSQSLAVIRGLRLLRVFRIFKLGRYLSEAATLRRAVIQSRAKLTVFVAVVVIVVVIMGSIMHLVEGPERGFTSIPQSMYWAIVTMTTVGYGDIAPSTLMGKSMASVLMLLGYSLIVVPAGIITAAAVGAPTVQLTTQACPSCCGEGHDADARHCKYCGDPL